MWYKIDRNNVLFLPVTATYVHSMTPSPSPVMIPFNLAQCFTETCMKLYIFYSCYSKGWMKVEGLDYCRPCTLVIGIWMKMILSLAVFSVELIILLCIIMHVVASQVYHHVSIYIYTLIIQTIVKYSSHLHAFVLIL